MATKAQQENNTENNSVKDLVNKDGTITELMEWATADVSTIEEMEALFGNQGVAYSTGEELTGDFRVITGDEKQLFLKRVSGAPVFVIDWKFNSGNNGEYVTMRFLVEGHGKFLMNDGSKSGSYGILSRITSERIRSGWTDGRERAGLKAPRGFARNNTFYYSKASGKAIPKAELDDWDAADKAEASPTWRLEF